MIIINFSSISEYKYFNPFTHFGQDSVNVAKIIEIKNSVLSKPGKQCCLHWINTNIFKIQKACKKD